MFNFTPRPKQAEVLRYNAGKMGVAAVPGAGKTRTLSALAAKIVASTALRDDQEVLIVTLVNSAVDNFARQVGIFVREAGLLPNVGYRVRTLHSLCNDIVRDRPDVVGLSEAFTIIDEREADGILVGAVEAYLKTHTDALDSYLPDGLADGRREWIYKEEWPELALSIARGFIKQAKDHQLTPDLVRYGLDRWGKSNNGALPLAEMGYQIYVDYERALTYRGAVDFQDLIRLALQALQADPNYLARLRGRFPYILEDEAQDSSALQEKILRLLAGPEGNWVRVGDPNQAIYETFTTADPELLRRFLREPDVQARELPNSGRSAEPILELANDLIRWTMERHPSEAIRVRAPLQPPFIAPTPPGDPQPNPPRDESRIVFYDKPLSPNEEVQTVVESLLRWLPEHPDSTVAVLAPRNRRGFEVVDALKKHKIEAVELLRSTTSTREAAGALGNILRFLAQPNNTNALATAFKVWRRDDRDDEEAAERMEKAAKRLRACRFVEEYAQPQLGGRDYLVDDEETAALIEAEPDVGTLLYEFRPLVQRWQGAVVLPIDQLILIIAQDLFQHEADLAIAHSLAVVLRGYGDTHPDWRLPRFTEELGIIAKNERRFLGVDDDDRGFDPDKHKGKVTVATMHSAKGLEWDRVYLMSVNTYDFPSALPGDQYMSEKFYLRDQLNLEAEALAQLHAATDDFARVYVEGDATENARQEYVAERLRLLYVGITRARRELIVTWNTGRRFDQQAAVPFIALANTLSPQDA